VTLADYYLADPRLVLVPIEHLGRAGMTEAFAALVGEQRGWTAERIALFDGGFARYWERTRMLAHSGTWAAPRLRNVAVIADPLAVRPYVQLLNTSTWLLYDCDLDPEISHAELVTYLLVHGDRVSQLGEITLAAVHDAAYWFERTDAERAAFAAAAARSPRPDAEAFRALAEATDWLRQLRHQTLRPPLVVSPHRPVPGTGLLVPRALDAEPPRLVAHWAKVAERALAAYYARWSAADPEAVRAACDWLAADRPPLLVTAEHGRIVWDVETPERLGALRGVLKQADGVAVRSILADLQVVAAHTRSFSAALVTPAALPAPAADTEQSGYTYLHRERGLIAYNLREAGMERLRGPDLPYARAMLGARTAHEWAHLAAMAGWVPRTVDDDRFAELTAAFAVQVERVIAGAPVRVRGPAEADLAALAAGGSAGVALARLLLTRVPDYQANLVAWRLMSRRERETYVRHNVRTLRPFYAPPQIWRMLIRYLYEYQYLGLSAVEDARSYFLRSTWFDVDFLASGVLDEARFDALAGAAGDLCTCYAIDATRLRLPPADDPTG
jgi:hypothetical protein